VWPLAARTQERMRRIGMISGGGNDPDSRARAETFQQSLQKFGWTRDRNIQFDYRRGSGNPADIRKHAADLVALKPDVILAIGTATMAPLLQANRNLPIIFVNVADPVGAGYVESLARPGGNATGFVQFEYSLSGKWPELLKEIAPNVTRVAVLRDPTLTSGIGQFAVIQAVAPSLGLEVRPISIRDADEIERAISAFARMPNGGLILTASGLSNVHRGLTAILALKHKLPTVAPVRHYAASGHLITYGPDLFEQYRRAAGYVDRILKGERPADLPVQVPTRYELVINLKTAKTLGLTVPPTLLARADEVIE
jgi:putative ABC transport system substrate-binding protein